MTDTLEGELMILVLDDDPETPCQTIDGCDKVATHEWSVAGCGPHLACLSHAKNIADIVAEALLTPGAVVLCYAHGAQKYPPTAFHMQPRSR